MYLRQLTIQNFRRINTEKNTFYFEKGFNFLIGPYNSCKSTILLSIDYLLEPYKPWWKNSILSKFDFFDITKPLNIEAIICCDKKQCIEFTISDEESRCNLLESDKDELSCMFSDKWARYFDLKEKKFLSIEEISEDGVDDENIVQAIKIRMIGNFNSELDYAEISHEIENKNDEWKIFSQKMREWLNIIYYNGIESFSSQFQLTSRSSLSKCLQDLKEKKIEIKKKLSDSFPDSIVFDDLKHMFEENEALIKFQPEFGKIGLNLFLSKENDFFKQFELSIEENGRNIPFSYQGKGFRHISYLILSLTNVKKDINYPIVIIDDPEQSLEPQRQRGLINLIKKQINKNSQMILTTHSPFILSPLLNLNNVSRIFRIPDGNLTQIRLDEVDVDHKKFNSIRKKMVNDSNLYESLFGEFILLWEGDTETGFFPTYMSQFSDKYSSEWFLGINCQGTNMIDIAKWLKEAGYKVLCVLDHDKKEFLNELLAANINFLAFPVNYDFENFTDSIVSSNFSISKVYEIALNYVANDDKIYYRPANNKAESIRLCWPDLYTIMKKLSGKIGIADDAFESNFNSNNSFFDLKIIKEEISSLSESQPSTLNFPNFMKRTKYKSSAYELAIYISKELDEIPDLLMKFLDKIQEIFTNQLEGHFYIDESGVIKNYKRS
jgi:predicted ATP-dependent endonuclease of OLD family